MDEKLKEALEQIKELLPDLTMLKKTADEYGVTVQELKKAMEEMKGDATDTKKAIEDLASKVANDKKAMRLNSISKGELDWEAKKDFFEFIKCVWKTQIDPKPEHGEKIQEFYQKYSIDGDPVYGMTKDTMNTSDDGFSIPQAFTNIIQAVADQASVGLQEASIIPIGAGNQLPQINLDTDVAAYWTGENAVFTESEPAATQTRTKLKKLTGYSEFTNEYLEDNEVGIVNWIIARFGMKMGVKIDAEVFSGDGTNFTGILNTSGVNVKSMGTGELAADITYDDLLDTQEQLPTALEIANNKWYMHKTVLTYLRKIKQSTNYVWQPPAGGMPATIWESPYRKVDQMPAASTVVAAQAFVIYGDLKNYGIGTKGGMRIMRDQNIQYDRALLAVRQRYVMNCLLPAAFAVLKAGAAS